MDEKRCCDCRRVLPVDCFHRNASKFGGRLHRASRCRECQSAYLKKWRARNREQLAVKKTAYYFADRERQRTWGAAWRARQHGAAGTLTKEDRLALIAAFRGLCAYCVAPATTFDHLMPLARGGRHDIENTVPSCLPCNAAKRELTPLEWFVGADRHVGTTRSGINT